MKPHFAQKRFVPGSSRGRRLVRPHQGTTKSPHAVGREGSSGVAIQLRAVAGHQVLRYRVVASNAVSLAERQASAHVVTLGYRV